MLRQDLTFDSKQTGHCDQTSDYRLDSLQLPYFATPFDPDNEIALLYGEALRLDTWKHVPLARVMDWCQRAHDRLAALSDPSSIARWQDLLGPFFAKSPFLDRAKQKPRGYAGDYRTVQMMYDAMPAGDSAFARGVDAWALSQPCPQAVRNRPALVHAMLADLGARFPGKTLSVTSLGSGPAAEVFDYRGKDAAAFTLVDIDPEAIRFVTERALTERASVVPLLGNLVKMVLGRSIALPDQQHAFYSLGVIDYFSDELVVRLLDYLHTRLRKGGVVLLGNFRPDHPNAAFFTHALDWRLRLRSEHDLRALVARSKFARSATRIGAERQGVQLFVECVKD